MSNLFATLGIAADALRAFDRGVTIEQNNTTNSTTAGYARQDTVFIANPFSPSNNLLGGVQIGQPADSRDGLSERMVWERSSSSGYYSNLATMLGQVQANFSMSDSAGIMAALAKLSSAFSAWSTSPESASARQGVIASASAVATSFNQTAKALGTIRTTTERDITATVQQINALAGRIQTYNAARLRSPSPDAGAEAGAYDALESLSKLANVDVLRQADGTFTVLLGGQKPLVIGDHAMAVSAALTQPAGAVNPGAPPTAQILAADGSDLTGQIQQGTLGGLLTIHNGTLAAILGDGNQAGSLNILAKSVADQINQMLAGGTDGQNPPQPGAPLFAYAAANPTGVAASLAIPSGLRTDQLAAVDPGPPPVSNGVASRLAALFQSNDPANQISGKNILDYYASISADVGQNSAEASSGKTASDALLTQARSLRENASGVSLDQEATRLVALQRSYQAAARVVTIVDELTATVLNLVK